MARFTLRLPDELHERAREAATEDGRSLNAEVEWLLVLGLSVRDGSLTSSAKDVSQWVQMMEVFLRNIDVMRRDRERGLRTD